jgi:hypothetical protein
MRTSKLLFLSILVSVSGSIYSQPNKQTKYSASAHDSLLFDGVNGNNFSFKDSENPCLMKVKLVNGNVTGTVAKKETINTCGKIETITTYEKRFLKEGDTVLVGVPLTTETGNDFILAQLADGENMFFGGERGKVEVQDYCKNPPNINMTLKAGKLGIDWTPVLPKTITVCSDGACIRIKGTVFSFEILKEGDAVVNVLKVFKGSVSFSRNPGNEDNKKNIQDKSEQMKKLSDDYQSGKISIEEFTQKMKDLQTELPESLSENEITVNAGFQSRITGTGKPSDPVPLDLNEKPWWEE